MGKIRPIDSKVLLRRNWVVSALASAKYRENFMTCSLSNFLGRDGQKDFFQRRRPGGESAQLHAVLARPRQYSPRIAHEVVGGDEVLGAIAKQSCSLNAWCLLGGRSEEHTSELQSRFDLVCRLLLEKKK